MSDIPNWCHNTLIVEGDDPADLRKFVEAVREPTDEKYLRDQYDGTVFVGDDPITFEQYVKTFEERRSPLSFQAIAPYDPAEWPDKIVTCTLCKGTGRRPDADKFEKENPGWIERSGGCNGCHGSGKHADQFAGGWYAHHLQRWGTKWDASFEDPFIALGEKGMNVDECTAAKGVTEGETMVVYKFDTAWSPPLPAILTASEQHPNLELRLRFGEPGGGFAGEVKCVAGVVVSEEELEVEEVLMPEEMWF